MATNEKFRGLGYDKELIQKVHEIAMDNNINCIDLNVSPDNVNALMLYEKLKFYQEKILLTKFLEREENDV